MSGDGGNDKNQEPVVKLPDPDAAIFDFLRKHLDKRGMGMLCRLIYNPTGRRWNAISLGVVLMAMEQGATGEAIPINARVLLKNSGLLSTKAFAEYEKRAGEIIKRLSK